MNQIYRIYTDGSHLKHTTGRLGIGGVIIDEAGNIVDKFSTELSVDTLKLSYGTSDVSNPTCEMLAVRIALSKFEHILKSATKVTIYADYTGVKNFCEGNWKCKMPYIAKIKSEIDNEIKKQHLDGRISFEWVRGHQKGNSEDVKWNNYVDLLAKGEIK